MIDASGLPEPVIRDIRQLVETLRSRHAAQNPAPPDGERKPLRGCLAGQGLKIPTLQEIEDVRREMWSDFPRETPDEVG